MVASITRGARSIPTVTTGNQIQVLQAIKAVLDAYAGQTDPQARVLQAGDFVNGQLDLGSISGGRTGGGGGTTVIVQPGGDGGYDPATDLTTPPQPTGLQAVGGYETVQLRWDVPDPLVFKNPSLTEVWASDTDVLGNAQLVGRASYNIFIDRAGHDQAKFYWIRFVSAANVTGPYNATPGTFAQTALDVASVLDALQGQISESQLSSDLGARIDLIDGIGTGSVNARLDTVSANLSGQISTLSTTVAGNITTLQIQGLSIDGIQAKYTVKIDNNGYVAGYGLISEPNNGTVQSSFAVRADRFSISSPTGPGITPITPFVVQTTPTTINGIAVPAGVYMDAAYILTGTIGRAAIGLAVIDDARVANLSADKVTFGTMSGDRIGVNTLNANRIVSRSITANQIAVGSLTATEIDSRNLTIKDSLGNVLFGSGSNLDYALIGGLTKPKQFRVLSRGLGAVGYPAEAGLYNAENNSLLYGSNRSYMLAKIRRSDAVIDFTRQYDVYGVAQATPYTATDLANDLNSTGSDHIVVVWTWDEPLNNRLTGGLPDALYRCGATPGVFGRSNFLGRAAYMLIGIGGCGSGNGYEAYAGTSFDSAADGPDDAWIDTTFSVVNGNPVFSGGGTSLFQINASNISTYIASAAIKSAYIESLDAAKITALSLSAISANIGTVTAGLLRNSSSTAVIDLNATGSGIFIHSGSFLNYGFYGNHYQFELKANGSGFMERGFVSPPQPIIYNSNYTITNDGIVLSTPVTYWTPSNTNHPVYMGEFTIDTTLDDPAGWSVGSQASELYSARVYPGNGTYAGGNAASLPLNTALSRVIIQATPSWSSLQYRVGSTSFPEGSSGPSGRIYLICRVWAINAYYGPDYINQPQNYAIQLNSCAWEVYRA